MTRYLTLLLLALSACGASSKEVAAATKSERGHDALIVAAKTLAMSALDLLGDPDLIARAKRELAHLCHKQALTGE